MKCDRSFRSTKKIMSVYNIHVNVNDANLLLQHTLQRL